MWDKTLFEEIENYTKMLHQYILSDNILKDNGADTYRRFRVVKIIVTIYENIL